jgi:hypothetical protein
MQQDMDRLRQHVDQASGNLQEMLNAIERIRTRLRGGGSVAPVAR